MIMRVGMQTIIVNFHWNQVSKKMLLCVTKQLFAPNFFENVL